eukprot:TRINITY_DN49506_c0_g1_i1.p1 TRINITY_DN49506_c0_g1~~TRINITY_DN49506_c0_g1_i1.p1  ORF type:complete len:191 (-),score=42.85 TRINITY_DN49506_c0_g1_i1:59-631(-)
MPPKKPGDAAPPGSASPKTWSELEQVKARLSLHMDRVEFLAGARDRFTEMSANQTRRMEYNLRSRSSPGLRCKELLQKATNDASGVLDEQQKLMTSSKTNWKRMEAINKYTIDAEMQRAGKELAEAAKRSARGTQPKLEAYPTYRDLHELKIAPKGKIREPPLMAVFASMPYMPPESALRHGRRNPNATF